MSAPKAFHNTLPHLRIYPGPGRAGPQIYLSQTGKFKHLSFTFFFFSFSEWSGLVVYSLRGTRACRVASVDGRGGRAFAYRVIARGSLSLIR